MVEVLRVGYCLPFLSTPPLSTAPIPMPSYSPTSIKGAALEEVTLGLVVKGAVELAPLPSPGFYSRLFVVWKTSGSWRPVIDLSHLNRFVDVSPFQMETIQSVLLISSGGGGGAISSWSLLPQGSSTFPSAGCGACPSCCWRGDRVHPFLLWFSCILLYLFIFYYFYLYCAFPCLPWVPRVGFYARVTHDVTSDSVPFWVPPPRTARALSTTWIVVSTLACIASSDRRSVALALFSSL